MEWLFCLIVTLWGILPTLGFVEDEVCEDLYTRYCEFITAERCYQTYNRKLCCATCDYFSMRHGVETDDSKSCAYGDRIPGCSAMTTNICYDEQSRIDCCGTCDTLKMKDPLCAFGDLGLTSCTDVKPHHCYKKSVRQECCGTCSKYYTGREGCEYGDQVHLFRKQRRMYNCQAYVAHFGHGRCRLPWDTEFSETCCGSCHEASYSLKSNRISQNWRRSGKRYFFG